MSSIKSILSIKEFTIPRYFWVLFMVFSVTASFLMMRTFQSYTNEITILAVHKNKNTSAHADQIMRTLIALPKTIGFYDRLLQNYPEIQDPWASFSEEERAQLWAQHVSMKQVDASDMMTLSVTAQSASDATYLTEKSADTLFRMVGQFYNIRTDLDLRVVERKEAHSIIVSPYLWVLTSILSGAVAAYIVAWLVSTAFESLEKRVRQKKTLQATLPVQPVELRFDKPAMDDYLEQRPQENGNKVLEFIVQREKLLAEQKKENASQAIDVPSQSLSNLPFLEEGVTLEEHLFGKVSDDIQNKPLENTEIQESVDENSEASSDNGILQVEKIHKEPTPEELKKRLNQLLRGE